MSPAPRPNCLRTSQPGGVVKYESSCDWRFQTPKILPKQEGFQLAEASFRENKNPSNSLSLASLAWIVTTMIHLNVCEWMSRKVSVHEGGVGKCWKRIRWGSVECGGDVPPRDCLHHALTGQCRRPGHVLQDTARLYIHYCHIARDSKANTFTYLQIHEYIFTYSHIFMYSYIHIHTNIHISIFACKKYIFIYLYIKIYVYILTSVYIYTHA